MEHKRMEKNNMARDRKQLLINYQNKILKKMIKKESIWNMDMIIITTIMIVKKQIL